MRKGSSVQKQSKIMANTLNLKQRLFQKGFQPGTLPSVKRPIRNTIDNSEPITTLGVNLNSFKIRQTQIQPMIIKQQSTVFQQVKPLKTTRKEQLKTIQPNLHQKSIEIDKQLFTARVPSSEKLMRSSSMRLVSKSTQRLATANMNAQNQANQTIISGKTAKNFYGQQHELQRLKTKTANFNDSQLRKTKYLVDKMSGKFNIDKKYLKKQGQQLEKSEKQFKIQEPQSFISPRPQSKLDKYIELVLKNVVNVDQFIYLKKPQGQDDPYDLRVIDYSALNDKNTKLNQYYTISKKGLCHYLDGRPIEFIHLNIWLQQRNTYDQIKALKFFTKFRKWKTLKMWRRKVLRQNIQKFSESLKQKLFILNDTLRPVILEIRKQTVKLQQLRIIVFENKNNVQSQFTYDLNQFTKLQDQNRYIVKEAIEFCSNGCREFVENGFMKVIEKLKHDQAKIKVKDDQFSKIKKKTKTISQSQKQAAYQKLGFNQKMQYQMRSQLRRQCSRFIRFAYLVDFISLNSLKNIYSQSIGTLKNILVEKISNSQELIIKDPRQKSLAQAVQPLFYVDLNPNFYDLDSTYYQQVQQYVPPPLGNSHIKNYHIIVHSHLKVPKKGSPTRKKRSQQQQQEQYEELDENKTYSLPSVHLCKKWVSIFPNADHFFFEILTTINQGLATLQSFQRWSRHSDIKKYLNVLQEWDDKVADDIQQAETKYLNPYDWIDTNEHQNYKKGIKMLIQNEFHQTYNYIERNFQKYLKIYWQNQRIDYDLFKNQKLFSPAQTIQYALESLVYQKDLFINQIPVIIDKGLLRLNVEKLKMNLQPNPRQALYKLYLQLPDFISDLSKQLRSYLISSSTSLKGSTSNIDQFVKQTNSLKDIQIKFPKVKEKIGFVNQVYNVLQGLKSHIPQLNKEASKEWKNNLTGLLQAQNNLENAIHTAEQTSQRNLERFSKDVSQVLIPNLNKQVSRIDNLVQQKKYVQNQISADIAIKQLGQLDFIIKKLEEDGKKYGHYQITLNLPGTKFQNLENLRNDLNNRLEMWKALKQWKQLTANWINGKFEDINTDQIKIKSDRYTKIFNKCVKNLPPNPILDELRVLLTTFKDIMPVVIALRNPNLLDYHWKEIKQVIGVEFTIDNQFTLKNLISLGFNNHQDQIIQISTQARQEAILKNQIEQNRIKWIKLEFESVPYKPENSRNKDAYVLTHIEDLYAELDDLLANFSNILGNRYLKRQRNQAQQLQKSIFNAMLLIDDWLIVQKNWIYLQNIFSSNDIKTKLRDQNLKFQTIDKGFKVHMRTTNRSKLVYRNLGSHDMWLRYKDTLSQIQKALQNYLQDKRNDFPRFYFLSNDELIQILAKANEIEAIQKNIRKCFQSVAKLQFIQDSKFIQSVISLEGQVLKLHKGNINAKGDIQIWLKSLEGAIDQTLRKLMIKGYAQYEMTKQRTKFVSSHLCQITLTICQIFWCLDTEAFMDNLTQYLKNLIFQLNQLTSLIRTELPDILRKTLVALITQDVHNRDIIQKLNTNQGGITKNDFQWLQQLRYYLQGQLSEGQFVLAKQVNAEIKYGYQYLGVMSRLVITPLTDRCWMTITGAINIKLGASPAGPAGTGKTQSTKDLAKGLGMLCVVFNCSEQIQYKMMGRLFSGLAQQGAWSCLDQFNRIDIQVLSVIAQQVLTIRVAMLRGDTQFYFCQRTIKLKPNCGVFITMNPGYAGRTQLPDNLKVLFRPVSMMIPDYRLIAEIMLFAQGFQEAKPLSKKMVQLYKLSSEQLSQQDHYDFGMRAVKSVLVMAGALKRAEKDSPQQSVLIRAMRDSNIPKFLKDDLPLFNALIKDLFPTSHIKEVNYGDLQVQIQQSIKQLGLQKVSPLITKILQLYDTFNVRFGVMIVGYTASGKTTCFELLAHAMTQLRINNHPDKNFQVVKTHILNPKAISMGELYGQVNQLTQEWHDGLASTIMRSCVSQQGNNRNWVVFDGPVDALWIQNMNTVLDDNMMLCLANGERIKLRNQMKMLFQVNDLRVASPATVSRCGMVYMVSQDLGWKPYVQTWLQKLFKNSQEQILSQQLKNYLYTFYFQRCIPAALKYLRGKCSQPIQTGDLQLVVSLCNLFEVFCSQKFGFKPSKTDKKKYIGYAFAYAFIWSFCVSANDKHHEQLSHLCKGLIQNIMWPNNDDVQNFYLDPNPESPSFINWNTRLTQFIYHKQKSFHEIYVETLDSLRYSFVIDNLYQNKKPVFITGTSGTGKSIHLNRLPTVPLILTSTTSPAYLQLAIQSKLQKIKKTLLGGKPGSIAIVAIDDTNMPDIQQFGAMPPVEVIRTIIDKKGVWDRKERFWKHIENSVVVCACAPPGGGRNPLPPRFTRHFNILCLPDPNQHTLMRIFKSILESFVITTGFAQQIKKLCENVVRATIQLYSKIKKQKLPIPSKFHYTFNLRDISKVFQGLLLMKLNTIRQSQTFAKLWHHQICRVFKDRLNTIQDHEWFHNLSNDILQSYFRVHAKQQKYYFTDVLRLETKDYEYLTDLKKVIKILDQKQQDYNSEGANKLHLVFFQDCVENILRISRILRLPRGNALLIGVSGSGKQSLTKLSAFINQSKVRQIQITKGYNVESFRQFIKDMMKKSSDLNQSTTFLFTDNQIISQTFLQDINNILNSGEVPNLWTIQQKDQVISSTKTFNAALKRPQDPETIYRTFVERVRQRLHVVLSMSPVGDSLRVRCRKFPALVDCCTLNWFFHWPSQALISVAHTLLDNYADFPLVKNITRKQLIQLYAQFCKQIHITAQQQAVKFQAILKRKVYTTPKSYLDMLKLYLKQLDIKMKESLQKRRRLTGGLDKLQKASVQVASLQIMLKQYQPQLQKQGILLAKALTEVELDSRKASQIQANVSLQAEQVARQKSQVQYLADQARQRLKQVQPELERAKKAVQTIDKKALQTIRGYPSPPAIVATIMEGVCILFGIKGDWDVQKKLLVKLDDFVTSLKQYNKDNIPQDRLVRLRAQLQKNQFKQQVIVKKVRQMLQIAQWCKAIEKYSAVAKQVQPKKRKMAQLQLKLDSANKQLAQKMSILNKAKQQVAKLKKNTQQMVIKKNQLEANLILTKQRLQRAGKLITLTKDQAIRWKQTVQSMREAIQNLCADVFISCGCISYNGPFTGPFRKQLIEKWISTIKLKDIPITQNFQIMKILGDPIILREWIIQGLPSDTVSVQNAIFATQGQRWPLMIDPQQQASKWLQKLEKKNKLKLTKLNESTFSQQLKGSIKNGFPVLIQDLQDSLPALLDPVLGKQIQIIQNIEMIKFGDQTINYDKNFKLFLVTKVANPNFLPQMFIKVNIINFTVTFEGLQQQLLAMVVKNQREDVQKQRDQNIIKMAEYNKKVTESQLNILRLLQNTEAEKILDDVQLIQTLETSKKASKQIKIKMKQSQQIQKDNQQIRILYESVAIRGSVLFFVIKDLSAIDPMYQYSLQYIQKLFQLSMISSQKTKQLDKRLKYLITNITRDVYKNVTRGLFQSHKLIFSFLISASINKQSKILSEQKWLIFIRGAGLIDKSKRPNNPDKSIFSERAWDLAFDIENRFSSFAGLTNNFISKIKQWQNYKQNNFDERLPEEWNNKLDLFQKMLIIKILKPEKIMFTLSTYVIKYLGNFFLQSPNVSMKAIFQDSDKRTPVIFVLSPGADPTSMLLKLKDQLNQQLDIISLGQGQGRIAENLLTTAKKTGKWVLLQNCHLAKTWMPTLQKLVQQNSNPQQQIDDKFRLYLTSMPASYFPISTLQNGIKLTTQPPRGIKSNLRRSWQEISEAQLQQCPKRPQIYHKLLWGLTFFHSIIQQRRKFGPLGWNIRYQFNDSDLQTSKTVLKMLLNQQDSSSIPLDALLFVTGDINYGGRVTDDWDRRLLLTILKRFYNLDINNQGKYNFSQKQEYYLPQYNNYSSYISYIDTLPLDDDTEIFGMNQNANITFQTQQSQRILSTLLVMQPRITSGSEKSPQTIISQMVTTMIKNKQIPELLSRQNCHKELFIEDEKGLLPSLSIVLVQEMVRFNQLLKVIKSSLQNLKNAIDGTVLMSDELDSMFYSLLNNIVPKNWQKVAYPSLKPLASWIIDLKQRVAFMRDWLQKGSPHSYWMSGLFFPQGFLTGVLQSHARRPGQQIPIDQLVFNFKFMDFEKEGCLSKPSQGVYIDGLILQGASFDKKKKVLVQSLKNQIYTYMPVIHFSPCRHEEIIKGQKYQTYQCPVYKTSVRAGILSTTGQSTNFVLAVDIPSIQGAEYWTLRGTALLCQLNE